MGGKANVEVRSVGVGGAVQVLPRGSSVKRPAVTRGETQKGDVDGDGFPADGMGRNGLAAVLESDTKQQQAAQLAEQRSVPSVSSELQFLVTIVLS